MTAKKKDAKQRRKPSERAPGTAVNPILGAVDTFIDRSREVIDPIKKVCYPVIETAKKPIEYLADPIKKVCYQPFVVHYEERYKKKYPKHAGKLYILDMALLAIIGTLVVAGMFAYLVAPAFPQPALITLGSEVPSAPISGERTSLAIAYANGSNATVRCADIIIEPPRDFVLHGVAEPAVRETETCPKTPMARLDGRIGLRLGELGPGARGRVALDGTLYGPSGETRILRAELRYWKAAATEPTRVPLIAEMRIAGSALALGITVPGTVIRGQVIPVSLTYENTGGETLFGTEIRLSAPEDFVITGAAPYRAGPADWRIGDIPAGTRGTITAWGYLRSAYRLSHSATFTVRGYVTEAGSRLLAESARTNADPRASGFDLAQRIASPPGRSYASPGETITVAVTYGNSGAAPLHDMRIRLYSDTRYLAPSEAGTVTWSSETTPQLAEVAPGESGTLTATFAVRDMIRPEDVIGDGAPTLSFATEAEAYGDDAARPVFADTPPDALALATRLDIAAAPVYYTPQGDQLGRGALPMTPGEATRIWVFLDVANAMNAVRDAVLEAALPEGVEWTGRYSVSSGEALDYLPLTRTVRWSIGGVEPFSGAGVTSAQFELSLTPTADQAGTAPVMLKNVRIEGMDEGTGVLLHAVTDDVTTQGLLDKDGNEAGLVTGARER